MPKLVLKRDKVLGGVKYSAGHLLASLEPTEGIAFSDVRLVLLTGEYELVDEPAAEPAAPDPIVPPPTGEVPIGHVGDEAVVNPPAAQETAGEPVRGRRGGKSAAE